MAVDDVIELSSCPSLTPLWQWRRPVPLAEGGRIRCRISAVLATPAPRSLVSRFAGLSVRDACSLALLPVCACYLVITGGGDADESTQPRMADRRVVWPFFDEILR